MRLLPAIVLTAVLGCASELKVFDPNGEVKGFPILAPVAVKVITTTTYEVDPNHKEFKDYCTPDSSEDTKVLPLGDRYFVTFDPAHLGKSEFKLEFTETALVKQVSLNSDPEVPEVLAEASKLLGQILPVLTPAPVKVSAAEEKERTAQEKKQSYCIKKSTKIELERLTVN
jgi:hypothetical protein